VWGEKVEKEQEEKYITGLFSAVLWKIGLSIQLVKTKTYIAKSSLIKVMIKNRVMLIKTQYFPFSDIIKHLIQYIIS
jgi:hypothetical protein